MSYRFRARSATPGDYNFTVGSLGFLPAATDVRAGVERGDGTLGTLDTSGLEPVAVPSLTIADNGDGTGAVATISGATAGTTNTVYVADWPLTTFSVGGNRVGTGTVALTLTTGPKLAYVISDLGGVRSASNLSHFRVTDGTAAIFVQCLTAVRDVVRGLALSGLSAEEVDVRKVPLDPNDIQAPRVIVSPVPETITPAWNVADDVGYGVMITMIQASNRDPDDGTDPFLLWRELISRGLRSKALPGVSEVYNVVIEPAVVVLPEAFQSMYDVGALVARCISEEFTTVV